MKKLLCRIFGHKWREQFSKQDSLMTSKFCARCGLGVQLISIGDPPL